MITGIKFGYSSGENVTELSNTDHILEVSILSSIVTN